jgi:hypothetical protein
MSLLILFAGLSGLWRTLRARGWSDMFYELALRMRTLTLGKLTIDWETSAASGRGLYGRFNAVPVTQGGQIVGFDISYAGSDKVITVPIIDTSRVSAW